MAGLIGAMLDPDICQHLLREEGEQVIDNVQKHWIVVVPWALLMATSIPLFILMTYMGGLFWIPMTMGLTVLVIGMWKAHIYHMDRFVITNMRVFRIHGVFNTHLATMPMTRILDISMEQPFWGKVLDYGHLVFESAAQAQGLREIRYIAAPGKRDLKIQEVIQRSGLRKKMEMRESDAATGV
ncbi:PH domain-containing protein [Arachnia propionica]|uniref:PH domain-containing protein n=1 Tax=Arachnia propionica TaxID=1750 RepID=A0A3P1TCG8_9ACTN|nr:PH domain-containing protein [Arachnia propionica]MDO5082594.1 PH domain-containing protein [Arachnia propionica]RRD07084.1 PH domain-containing protein [Arachnia propionica]